MASDSTIKIVRNWLRLDRYEQERGQAQGRPRVKVVSREIMLRVAREPAQVPDAA